MLTRLSFNIKLPWHLWESQLTIKELGRADTVGAALVFLDLLKGQPKIFSELFLAYTELFSEGPHSSADVDVDGIRGPFKISFIYHSWRRAFSIGPVIVTSIGRNRGEIILICTLM